jgi:hypothetical protein
MPEQDADLLKVRVGQLSEHREINSVLDKALGVLGHAEPEPIRNFPHCGRPPMQLAVPPGEQSD